MTTDTTVYICNRKHYILCYTSCVTTYQNDKKIMRICRFFCSLHYAGVSPRQARWQHFMKIPAAWQKWGYFLIYRHIFK